MKTVNPQREKNPKLTLRKQPSSIINLLTMITKELISWKGRWGISPTP
jgi:hypothetical protein